MLETIDNLHELDSQLSGLLEKLPHVASDDPKMQEVTKIVGDQSMALAFDKLALVSQVSGPEMQTPTHLWDNLRLTKESADHLQLASECATSKKSMINSKALGLTLTLLIFSMFACAMLFLIDG